MCKILQKKSLDLLEAVNIAEDIPKELKSVRENAEHEFHQLYSCAQETAETQNFTLEVLRRTSRMINRCNIAAETDEEYFRVGIFIPFLDNFIASLESRFTAHKSIIGGLQCLIPANPNVGPNAQQIESIQVLGKFYQNDLTKSPEELVSEHKLWYRKLSRLNIAKKATDALNSINEFSSAFSTRYSHHLEACSSISLYTSLQPCCFVPPTYLYRLPCIEIGHVVAVSLSQ